MCSAYAEGDKKNTDQTIFFGIDQDAFRFGSPCMAQHIRGTDLLLLGYGWGWALSVEAYHSRQN